MPTIKITTENFDAAVTKSQLPVLVDFWAEWCGPCRQIAPALDELSEVYGGRIVIAKVNVEEHPEIAAAYGVRAIPTMAMIRNGAVADIKVGAAPKAVLADWIEKNL